MENEKPIGGKWSFDDENEKKLPKEIDVPMLPVFKHSKDDIEKLKNQISLKFKTHYGDLETVWFPMNRKDSLLWLDNFLFYRFHNFGTYEDALHTEHNFIFSQRTISLLNIGLLTPKEVLERSISYAAKNKIPSKFTRRDL